MFQSGMSPGNIMLLFLMKENDTDCKNRLQVDMIIAVHFYNTTEAKSLPAILLISYSSIKVSKDCQFLFFWD